MSSQEPSFKSCNGREVREYIPSGPPLIDQASANPYSQADNEFLARGNYIEDFVRRNWWEQNEYRKPEGQKKLGSNGITEAEKNYARAISLQIAEALEELDVVDGDSLAPED